ncbi:MAG: PEP-CTERM sorting domain-containing protein [Planctomycetota bacterium]
MKTAPRHGTSHFLIACVAATTAACAASSYANGPDGLYAGLTNLTNSSFVNYGVQQDGVGFFGIEDEVGGEFSASFARNRLFGNEEVNGVFGVSGSASAESIAGILRASAQIAVTDNSVTDFDLPYLTNDFSDNPDGIPTSVEFDAFASFTDQLQFGSTATGYTSRYLIRVTGEITAPGAFVAIDVNNGNGQTETFFFSKVGVINEVISTRSTPVTGSQQEFGITVQATASAFPEFDGEGFASAALFSSTLEVIGLEVRDDTGALVDNSEGFVTTAGGAAPTIIAVPEPASLALLGLAGTATLMRRKRNG